MTERFTPEQAAAAAVEHIKLYANRIKRGEEGLDPSVNVGVCQGYLAIWQRILDKGGKTLAPREKSEVLDALDSGEYDHIFRKAE